VGVVLGCCIPVLGVALGSVHVGVGRSPGSVDLPVARDAYGVPYLPGSGLKGSVKSLCILRYHRDPGFCEELLGWDVRLRGGVSPEEVSVSPVLFTDGLLLLAPVRVEVGGRLFFMYATSLLQLSRALNLASACGGSCRITSIISSLRECVGHGDAGFEGELLVNSVPVSGESIAGFNGDYGLACLRLMLEKVSPLASLLLGNGVIVFRDDGLFLDIVEAGLERVTRVRLDPAKKTVISGALWTEEYVPQGSVFFFTIMTRSSQSLDSETAHYKILDLLGEIGLVINVGGKESVGKGLLGLAVDDCCNTCSPRVEG